MGHCRRIDEPALSTAGARQPVARQDYRDAMSRLGAAVNIVTTDGPGGRHGFTASAVCSVTDSPPTLLVCLNRDSSVSPAFHANGVLCVNTLASEQRRLSELFGGRTPAAERFAAADWAIAATGAPMLVGAVASFDCRIVRTVEVGTHAVLFCEVFGLATGDAREGLVYFSRRYHALDGGSSAG